MTKTITISLIILLLLSTMTAKTYYTKYIKLQATIEVLKRDADKKREELKRDFENELSKLKKERDKLESREKELIGIIDSYAPDYSTIGVHDQQEMRDSDRDSREACSSETRTNAANETDYSKECRVLLESTLRSYERSAREAQSLNAAYTSCFNLLVQ